MDGQTAPAHVPRTRLHDLVNVLLLVVVEVFLYRHVGRLSWTYDDAFHLNVVRQQDLASIFFDESLWRSFGAAVFTPLLLASMKFDLLLFGLDPYLFYVHQLISLAAATALLYALARLWLPPLRSFCGTLIAVLGLPTISIVTQLMLRHYIEGLVLALLSTILFVLGERRRSVLMVIAAAGAYGAAMSAKEIYVPLILLLPPLARRKRSLIPHVLVAIGYVLWRTVMLGPQLRGYGWAARLEDWPHLIATIPIRAAEAVIGGTGWLGIAAVVMLLSMAFAAIRSKHAFVIALIMTIAALAPVAPVSIAFQPRYAFVIWMFGAIGAAFAATGRRTEIVLVVTAVLVLGVNRMEWPHVYSEALQMSEEARTLPRLKSGEILWMPATPPAAIAELARLTGAQARWLYDPLPLCSGRLPATAFFAYENATQRMRAIPREQIARECGTIRAARMRVQFQMQPGKLFWDFGPYQDGHWRMVLADGAQAFDVPSRAGFHLPTSAALPVRVRYRAPAGWTTYSPELTLDLTRDGALTWTR